MIPTPTMQLGKPEPGDEMEPYFLGTMPALSFWEALERLSEHDHTGGVLGKPITAATIPDGSITTSKLDPSVLAPYALVDGSKPFTGQVEMEADALIRDALLFGPQGSTAAPDATLQRTAAGELRLRGAAARLWLEAPDGVGKSLLLANDAGLLRWTIDSNTNPHTGGNAGSDLVISSWSDAGAYLGSPFQINRATGSFTLSPSGAVWGLSVANGAGNVGVGTTAPGNVALFTGGGYWHPLTDNQLSWGHPGLRFTQVCAVAGTINTSSADAKTGITPLDPAAAMAAVLATDPVVFDYLPPVRAASYYELPDDPEQAEAVLLRSLTAAPLEAAARHQAGFVLGSPDYATDPLFETGKGQSNPANSVGVIVGALHDVNRRLKALEGA